MLRFLPAALLLFVFASCTNNDEPGENPGTRLVKVIDLEDPDDSSYFDRYSYDNSGRVTEIYTGTFNDVLATFHYTGASTKPYKMNGEGDETTHFFDYDANGRLVRDSSTNVFSVAYNVTTYTYFPGLVITESWHAESPSDPHWYQEKDSLILDAGGNVIEARYYIAENFFGGPANKLNLVEKFSYDSRINPYGMLNIAILKKYNKYGPMETIHNAEYFQEHNPVRTEYTDYDMSGTSYPTETETSTYQYRSNNYPSEATYTGTGYMGKVLYMYQ